MSNLSNGNKVIFIITSMGKGGAERVISILANDFVTHGYSVDIICLLKKEIAYELDERINIIDFSNIRTARWRMLFKWGYCLRKYIQKQRVDVVISFIAEVNIITSLACLFLKHIKLIVSERSDPLHDNRAWYVNSCSDFAYLIADKLVVQSQYVMSCFPKYIQKKACVIYNPINVNIRRK